MARGSTPAPGRHFIAGPREAMVEITVTTKLRGDLATKLEANAARLKRAPVELLADIIQHVLEDDLVPAVLDEGRTP